MKKQLVEFSIFCKQLSLLIIKRKIEPHMHQDLSLTIFIQIFRLLRVSVAYEDGLTDRYSQQYFLLLIFLMIWIVFLYLKFYLLSNNYFRNWKIYLRFMRKKCIFFTHGNILDNWWSYIYMWQYYEIFVLKATLAEK